MVQGAGLRTETTRPPLGDIQIDFENSPLRPDEFHHRGDGNFEGFSQQRFSLPQE